ncbi:TPA: Y-family DNA polymerase [Candidatus Ventrenecus avicola]|nr:Y-family DNA polymerase [Candidatus Ventrenecus avicola]
MERIHRHILCIDLKSFFASVECVDRGLNAFTTPLVVANTDQGNGAITLAVSPYLKAQGIGGRTRLYQIPKNIPYKKVPPRMKRYIEMSKKVVAIYLSFVSQEDLHIYSIDECFLDVTGYLSYYKKSDYDLAEEILKTVEEKTGLTATCGIGPNMLLAKLSMDIEAKKYKNGIAKWTYEDVSSKLWPITPLSQVWGIGKRMEQRLNNLGIQSIGDLAHYDKNKLKAKFGVLGEELWMHANGIDNSIIADFRHQPKEKSFSHSQVLMRDYYNEEVFLVIEEMAGTLTRRLRSDVQECQVIGFGITYSKVTGGGFYHSLKMDQPTDDTGKIYAVCLSIFDKFYEENMPIRKVSISLGKLSKKSGRQLDLFSSLEIMEKQDKMMQTIDEIHEKFGKNSLLKTTSLLSNSTIRDRNQKIGGHHE